jgi:hypothetical protein
VRGQRIMNFYEIVEKNPETLFLKVTEFRPTGKGG